MILRIRRKVLNDLKFGFVFTCGLLLLSYLTYQPMLNEENSSESAVATSTESRPPKQNTVAETLPELSAPARTVSTSFTDHSSSYHSASSDVAEPFNTDEGQSSY
jgi:hypothetical protein